MNPTLSIAASGMRYASDLLGVTANNVANTLTDGFKASRLTAEDVRGGGVRGVLSRDNTSGPMVPDLDGDHEGLMRELSNVDLETEAVSTIVSLRSFEANAAVFKTAADMAGVLFNRRA